jgi:rhamnogalacturonyl hydrolase YesR
MVSRLWQTRRLRTFLLEIGNRNDWSLQKEGLDESLLRGWARGGPVLPVLYQEDERPEMIAPTQERFDWIMANPKTGSLEWSGWGKDKYRTDCHYRWGWCDALFMAPPVWARLAKVTGERKYLDFMHQEYLATYDLLWDREALLFWRDSSYFEQREKNGEKVFWSRGNGWVLAGLALMIPDLPVHWEQRDFYVDLFKQMAERIKASQREDGSWSMGMLGAVSDYPEVESSGTAFFAYGLAWGINNGLLERDCYEPVVIKAWQALAGCVNEDGMLGYVQPVGAAPGQSFADKTEVYGIGAFLAAGAEVFKMLTPEPVAYGRFVPERSDDFAFENDKVAFRVYGPALKESGENNGVDAWLKRVDYPVIDKWYRQALEEDKSYHKDWGEGYDPYHVGSSLGAGSHAIWQDGALLQPNVYRDYKIIENGPDRVVFVLSYVYEEIGIEERKQITLELGSQLFRVDSTFTKEGEPVKLDLVVGVTTHEGKAEAVADNKLKSIATWETIHDSELGTGVVLEPKYPARFRLLNTGGADGSHAVFITSTGEDGKISYHAGYGWKKAGEITTFDQWQSYLRDNPVSAAGNDLIYEEDFESGEFSLTLSGNSPKVIKVADARDGQYVMKSKITPSSENSYRTEASSRNKLVFEVGEEYWVGISIKLDEDFLAGSFHDQGIVLQWHYFDWLHPEVRDAQPLLLRYIGKDTIIVENEVLQETMARVPADIGEWVDYIFHYKIDDQNGIIQVWRNGERIVDWKGDNHQIEKHDGAYLKFGLYSAQYNPKKDFYQPMSEGNSRTVYHDELRIAGADGSYELVAPGKK